MNYAETAKQIKVVFFGTGCVLGQSYILLSGQVPKNNGIFSYNLNLNSGCQFWLSCEQQYSCQS